MGTLRMQKISITGSMRYIAGALLAGVMVFAFVPDAYPQTGTVKSFQKISDTQGAFTGGLVNNDNFGSAVASLGDLDGDGVVDLAVGAVDDDDGGAGRGATWIIFLNDNNSPVLAAIGNQTVNEGILLQFTVMATDADSGDALTFTASNLPTGASFDTSTQKFTWTPDFTQMGDFPSILFTVTDDATPSASDSETITITVSDANPPVANAGDDQTVNAGTVFTLDGTGSSDPDGAVLSFSWALTMGMKVTLADPNASSTSFTVPATSWPFTFTLTVTDPDGSTATDMIKVTVVNLSPVADAGPNQTVSPGAVVTLDGSASSDPDSDQLTYVWFQTGGSAVSLSGKTSATTTFTAPSVPGPMTFRLEITDGRGGFAVDTVKVRVQ